MSPAAKLNPSSPNWHRLPNSERKLISLGPYTCSPAPSCSPSGAKTSQMGVMNPATPKIYNIPPQQQAQPPAHIWQCLYLFTSAPNPLLNIPAPYTTTPALSSGTLGKTITIPTHPKDPITDPNHPRLHGWTLFFTFFWVVGKYHYACMK